VSELLREQVALRLSSLREAGVRRLSVDVSDEQVTLWLRTGRLHASCTCARSDCEHMTTALQLVAGGTPSPLATIEPRARSSSRPIPAADDLTPLAAAFEDLCLATVRAGMAAAESPSIKDALRELLSAAPKPTPLPVARWVGRLQEALATGDAALAAQLFDGALQWAEQLRARDATSAALTRRHAWLAPGDSLGSESLADVTLLEVAREWVAGCERAEIERRYLVELSAGSVFVEERRRNDLEISVGPCPRLAVVAFAELASAARPARARLLQYTMSLSLGETVLARLAELAETQVISLRERYVRELREAPGLAEPFAIFAGSSLESGPQGALRDLRGDRLGFAAPQTLGADAVRAALRGGELVCVLGRLLGRASELALQPLSVLVRCGAWLELQRIT